MWVKNPHSWLGIEILWEEGDHWYFATRGFESQKIDVPVIWWGMVEKGKGIETHRYDSQEYPDVAARDAGYQEFFESPITRVMLLRL